VGRDRHAGPYAAGDRDAVRKIVDDPDVKSKLGNVGFEAFSSTPKEFEDFVKVQLGKWSKMVKDAGIQPE